MGTNNCPLLLLLLLLLDEKWTKALELIHWESQIDSMLHRKKYLCAVSCACPTAYKKLSFTPQSLSQTFAQLTLFALTQAAYCPLCRMNSNSMGKQLCRQDVTCFSTYSPQFINYIKPLILSCYCVVLCCIIIKTWTQWSKKWEGI